MSYSRQIKPLKFLSGEAATAAYVAIGMGFSTFACSQEPNIEDTLLAASIEGMAGDLRTLAMLTDWLAMHVERVNADRLGRLVALQASPRVQAYWASIATWHKKDTRFSKMQRAYAGDRIDLDGVGTHFLLKRRGEDARFADAKLRVPKGLLRHRPTDIASPAALAQKNVTYRWRILMGPSYRADMWAVLEREPKISAAALARCTYGSFATAWQVKLDWQIVHASQAA